MSVVEMLNEITIEKCIIMYNMIASRLERNHFKSMGDLQLLEDYKNNKDGIFDIIKEKFIQEVDQKNEKNCKVF